MSAGALWDFMWVGGRDATNKRVRRGRGLDGLWERCKYEDVVVAVTGNYISGRFRNLGGLIGTRRGRTAPIAGIDSPGV
jgi:hypothetical protein